MNLAVEKYGSLEAAKLAYEQYKADGGHETFEGWLKYR